MIRLASYILDRPALSFALGGAWLAFLTVYNLALRISEAANVGA